MGAHEPALDSHRMRIDQRIATEPPELNELQTASIALQQQPDIAILFHRVGKFIVPTALTEVVAAYVLFAGQLAGSKSFAIPSEAARASG